MSGDCSVEASGQLIAVDRIKCAIERKSGILFGGWDTLLLATAHPHPTQDGQALEHGFVAVEKVVVVRQISQRRLDLGLDGLLMRLIRRWSRPARTAPAIPQIV